MTFLFNRKGEHVANFVNGHLHAPNGKNIGHYLEDREIFIDMRGHYLGQIVQTNRLMYNRSSPYKSTAFGSHGNFGNVGNFGSPGHAGNVGAVGGFDDIETPWLDKD